jgi:hypothetical protein
MENFMFFGISQHGSTPSALLPPSHLLDLANPVLQKVSVISPSGAFVIPIANIGLRKQ